MGMFCQITCDRNIDGAWPDDVLTAICDSQADRAPAAPKPAMARSAAKRAGWVRREGRDICPGCQRAEREGVAPFIMGAG